MILYHNNVMFNTNQSFIATQSSDEQEVAIRLITSNPLDYPIAFIQTSKTPSEVIEIIAEEIKRGTEVYNLRELEG